MIIEDPFEVDEYKEFSSFRDDGFPEKFFEKEEKVKKHEKRIRYAVISMGLIFMLMISGCLRTYTHEKVEMVTQIFHAIPDWDKINEMLAEIKENNGWVG